MLKRFLIDKVLEPVLSHRRLERLAIFLARLMLRIKRPIVIAVTGSVGKSTTTALISFVLSHPSGGGFAGRVGSTVSNMNDDLGVAATLLRYTDLLELPWNHLHRVVLLVGLPLRFFHTLLLPYPKVMVLECGLGDTSSLYRVADIVRPKIAVVTRIGAAHIERAGSLSAVVDEKGALVRAVPPHGLVLLGTEHPYVSDLELMSKAPVRKFDGQGIELSLKFAKAILEYLGVSGVNADLAAQDFRAPSGRLSRIEAGGITIIDDTYNANPLSMKLGLDTLGKWADSGRRKVAVLGGMAELGPESAGHHEEIGRHARASADYVVGVGELAKGFSPDVWFENSEACASRVTDFVRPGDCVLVKGSASVKMKIVVQSLASAQERV